MFRRLLSKALGPNLLHGFKDFDRDLYLRTNPDVAQAKIDPLTHYVYHGRAEGRTYPRKAENIAGGSNYERVVRSGYFDPGWYVQRYADVRASATPPLQHFLEFGAFEGRDPGPHFSTSWYLQQYPDIRGMNPLLHYLEHGVREGRSPAPPVGMLEAAKATFASIADLDPELYNNERFYAFESVPVAGGPDRNDPVKAALRALLATIPATATHFIFVPWCIHSGADAVAANIAQSAARVLGLAAVALIVVDFDRIEGADWLPEGLTIINFAKFAAALSNSQKRDLVEKMLKVVRPAKIVNINSHLTWDLMRERGKFIANYSDLYACIFCRDYNSRMQPAGYADSHFRDTVRFLNGVYLDNETFAAEISRELDLQPVDVGKFKILKQPIRFTPANPGARVGGARGLRVFWASRIVKQKHYELLADIINESPSQVSFSIWGGGEDPVLADFKRILRSGARVEILGPYASFNRLPLEKYDAFLYTSRWDGIPNVLLEAAACGFPVVASDVGGVAEVVSNERGWLIARTDDPRPYVEALTEILRDRVQASRKGESLAQFVKATHSWEKFESELSGAGQFLERAR